MLRYFYRDIPVPGLLQKILAFLYSKTKYPSMHESYVSLFRMSGLRKKHLHTEKKKEPRTSLLNLIALEYNYEFATAVEGGMNVKIRSKYTTIMYH